MKTLALGAVAALTFVSAAFAQDVPVRSYKPFAAFNVVVGEARFTGYFTPGPDRCDVTMFQTGADDEALSVKPRRMVFQIAAGGRNELDAGPDAALAVACTSDVDALKLAPQRRLSAAKL